MAKLQLKTLNLGSKMAFRVKNGQVKVQIWPFGVNDRQVEVNNGQVGAKYGKIGVKNGKVDVKNGSWGQKWLCFGPNMTKLE